MRISVFCLCHMVFSAAVAASAPKKVTLNKGVCEEEKVEHSFYGVPGLKADINQLAIFHFPANAALGRCTIYMEGESMYYYETTYKLSTSHGAPCGFGVITSPSNIFEDIDLCSVNSETRMYGSIMLRLDDRAFQSTPEFNLVITPTWMCDSDHHNVTCCDDEYAKDVPEYEMVSPENIHNFTILCDGQYCIDEAYVCDGVESCADGKDEGEVCDVGNDGRGRCVGEAWVAATVALLLTRIGRDTCVV